MREYRLGVDLGGTKTAIIALNRANQTVFQERRATPSHDYRAIIANIRDLVARACEALGCPADTPVGVGIPGSLQADDTIVKNANTQVLIGEPLAQDLREALGAPVAIANDATCFIASEAADGAAAGAKVAFGVIIGTGVGGGIAVEGRPLVGRNRLCGEWGHNPFPNYGRPPTNHRCYCGELDCIETVLSGPALARDFRTATEREWTAARIAEAAAAGDPAAKAAIATYAENLARALSTVVNLLDPDVIVLGGGLSNIDALYQAVPRQWDRFAFNACPDPEPIATRLVKNRWGDDSGLRGAAWLTTDPRPTARR